MLRLRINIVYVKFSFHTFLCIFFWIFYGLAFFFTSGGVRMANKSWNFCLKFQNFFILNVKLKICNIGLQILLAFFLFYRRVERLIILRTILSIRIIIRSSFIVTILVIISVCISLLLRLLLLKRL